MVFHCASAPAIISDRSTSLDLSSTSGCPPAAEAARTSALVNVCGTSMASINIFSPAFRPQELSLAFAGREEFKVLDEHSRPETKWPTRQLVISATVVPVGKCGLELSPWGRDEWIEYMLARWRVRCTSVMGRVLRDSFADR